MCEICPEICRCPGPQWIHVRFGVGHGYGAHSLYGKCAAIRFVSFCRWHFCCNCCWLVFLLFFFFLCSFFFFGLVLHCLANVQTSAYHTDSRKRTHTASGKGREGERETERARVCLLHNSTFGSKTHCPARPMRCPSNRSPLSPSLLQLRGCPCLWLKVSCSHIPMHFFFLCLLWVSLFYLHKKRISFFFFGIRFPAAVVGVPFGHLSAAFAQKMCTVPAKWT